jgi:DNA-3-methyladenine glycosylase
LSPERRPLPRSFYDRPAEEVAPDLLGALLISTVDDEPVVGRIVEVEAYIGSHDDASHAAERIGRTERNAHMFGPPGIAYVYRIYGTHWCVNAVTGPGSLPSAVLVRALEPLEGLDVMHGRREAPGGGRSARASGPRRRTLSDRDLCAGPGRLAAALGITGALDGHLLSRSPLLIARGKMVPAEDVVRSARVGITRAADWPLRFSVAGSPWVSRPRP